MTTTEPRTNRYRADCGGCGLPVSAGAGILESSAEVRAEVRAWEKRKKERAR